MRRASTKCALAFALLGLTVINPNFALAGTPGVISVSPNSGAGLGPQIFTATYTDPVSVSNLYQMYLSFGSSQPVAGGCTVLYKAPSNQLYLYNDAGTTLLGPITEGSTSGTLSNSQCSVSSGVTAVTRSGNGLSVPFNITFLNAFDGKKTVYAWASEPLGTSSGGQKVGAWSVAPALIKTAIVNYTDKTLTISGIGFGSSPQVILGTLALTVSSASTNQIVAGFPMASPPSTLAPGEYLLAITFGSVTTATNITLGVE